MMACRREMAGAPFQDDSNHRKRDRRASAEHRPQPRRSHRCAPPPRGGHGGARAAVPLAKRAALLPAALVVRLGAAEAALFARRRDLAAIDAKTVFSRNASAAGLERVAEARVPLTEAENARLIAFRPRDGGAEHLAILIGY